MKGMETTEIKIKSPAYLADPVCLNRDHNYFKLLFGKC